MMVQPLEMKTKLIHHLLNQTVTLMTLITHLNDIYHQYHLWTIDQTKIIKIINKINRRIALLIRYKDPMIFQHISNIHPQEATSQVFHFQDEWEIQLLDPHLYLEDRI